MKNFLGLAALLIAAPKTMSLKQMQEASGGDLSVVDINKALADLQTLPPR